MPSITPKKTYHIITYGCQMNENDSEHLAGQLQKMGYEYSEKMEQADLILVNTCCVRESAEKKIYGKIGELKKIKAVNPNLIIGIVGCMAQKDKDNLLKKASHIDLVMGTHNLYQFTEMVEKIEKSRERIVAVWDETEKVSTEVPAIHKGNISAWVPIIYGCNNFCTYCIVPYVRGRERSRPLSEIVAEVKELGQTGFKEITLLGQNVNSYGNDSEGSCDFADLLAAVDRVENIERIRYMTSHPRDMNDKIIDTIKNSQKICDHFHLPIQSGSDTILKKMNRGYTTEYYSGLVARIRQAIPNASITTDLIVGFPGETDELFQETLRFIETTRFDAAYTFLYSQRSGTPAATMTEQIPLAIKKARLQALMDIQNNISLTINKGLERKTVEVLVEGTSKNDASKMMGRTTTNKIVIWDKNEEKVGQVVKVQITKAQTWILKGKAIQ